MDPLHWSGWIREGSSASGIQSCSWVGIQPYLVLRQRRGPTIPAPVADVWHGLRCADKACRRRRAALVRVKAPLHRHLLSTVCCQRAGERRRSFTLRLVRTSFSLPPNPLHDRLVPFRYLRSRTSFLLARQGPPPALFRLCSTRPRAGWGGFWLCTQWLLGPRIQIRACQARRSLHSTSPGQ